MSASTTGAAETPGAYRPPVLGWDIDLQLSRNEGRAARPTPRARATAEELTRYPDAAPLAADLAARHGVTPREVLVTAGGDDALLRCCLATLAGAGGSPVALMTGPTFEMIPRYVRQAGGEPVEVPWADGAFPTTAFLAAARDLAGRGRPPRVAFVVSPNNPTGGVATAEDLARIARALPETLVVLDAAYGEFAAADLTPRALELDNVVTVRTFSKAWGLASARVGYLLGPPAVLARLAAVGNPYPVAGPSLELARGRLTTGRADLLDHVARVGLERAALERRLEELGATVARPSEANFVLARDLDPTWTTAAAASLGLALRAFPDRRDLADAVRVTLPAEEVAFARLVATLEAALAPEALLFDLDGVLADVSGSYRRAILDTAADFGVELTPAELAAAKAAGGANDDWALTRDLLAARGVDADLAEVTARFEARYQGTDEQPGLWTTERALVPDATWAAWAERLPLAVVTGRPRRDAQRFLADQGLADRVAVLVAREDAPLKPDPAPVSTALARLGVRRAWMLGDTPDDLVAARGAGVVPLGVVAPGTEAAAERATLAGAGAARVLDRTTDLTTLLDALPARTREVRR